MKVVTTITVLAVIIATCSGAGILSATRSLLGLGEGAPYKVVKKYEGFEERLYPAQKWVTTTMEGRSKDDLSSPMFRRLFNYIGGNNSLKADIDMTTPVTTHVKLSNPFSYTMGFYVPKAHQANVPTGDSNIAIEDRPELRVLTRRFGGYAEGDVVEKESKALSKLIEASGQTGVDFDQYYIVGYNPPFQFFNRRNEIWYIKN